MASIDMQAYPAPSIHDCTLIVPVVTVGSVPQLAADLIINTLRLERTARLSDPALLPAVGSKPYDHVPGLATALELYGGDGAAVVQQRAAAAPGTQVAFAQRLAAFVKECGVKEVLVLGSIEASARRDAQMAGPQLRCWAPSGGAGSLLQRCGACSALSGGLASLEASFFEDRPLTERLLPPWPLLHALQQAGVPCAAVLSFSTEGDNVGEAFQMAAAAAEVAGLQLPAAPAGQNGLQGQLVPPASWQYVFGGAATAVY